MAQNKDPRGLRPKQEQLIYALLRAKTKKEASRMSGIPHRTMYRWLADPRFIAELRAARRQVFDDALFCLERNALMAAQRLADEIGETTGEATGEYSRIRAATCLLDRAFKAQGVIAVEEELAEVRANMARLKAGAVAPPVIVERVVEVKSGMTAQEQAEACRLRMEWMGELGHPLEDITTSLRYNRPQSVEEERETLGLVQQQLEQERTCTSLLETGGVLGD